MQYVKKLGMGLAVAVAVLLGLELLFALAGLVAGVDLRVSPLPQPADHNVLCATDAPGRVRLCPDRGAEWDRVRDLTVDLAPKGERVAFIGESFVYGLGLELEDAPPARLEAVLGGPGVVNLGRCGTYASRLYPQVQAAVTLDADVIVLAVGNNEHTMTSFYTGVLGRYPLETFRLLTALSHSRLFGLLSRAVGAADGMRVAETVDSPAKDLTDPVDAQVYAARRRPPDLSLFPQAVTGPEVTRILESEQRLKEEVFEGHLRELVRIAGSGGAEVVLVTLPWALHTAPSLSGTQRISTDEAVALMDKTLRPGPEGPMVWAMKGIAADPFVAEFHHVEGREYWKEGRIEEAVRAWRVVAEHDLIPDATPSINAIIRRVAAQEGARLADVHDDTALRFTDDPEAYFLDKVHVSAAGSQAVAEALAPTVAEALAGR